MIYIYGMAIIAIGLVWIPWLWRYQLKPHYAKTELDSLLQKHPSKKSHENALFLLKTLYRGVHAKATSLRERKRLSLQEDAFIYGEIDFLSFIFILEKVKPQGDEIFYDLGSGAGKAVFAAALAFPFLKVYGIELLPGLHKIAMMQINKANTLIHLQKELTQTYLPRLSTIHFLNDDFLDRDISDGDIIFINATCLTIYTWEAVVQKLLDLKPGSRVIVTTKKIQHEQFTLLSATRELMSWGLNSVNIYLKK